MNPFSLPENKYGNVTCWDERNGVILPDGFVITGLSITQLKKIKIQTVKAFVGFEFVSIGGSRWGRKQAAPKLVNLIRVEDEARAQHYANQVEMAKKYKFTKTDDLNWLFN